MPNQQQTFVGLFPRVAMSFLFKYYWHSKLFGSQAMQRAEKDFYHHTCDNGQKLASPIEKAKSLCPRLLEINRNDGNITINSTASQSFVDHLENYVRWCASQDTLSPDADDVRKREQIRLVPFSEQAIRIFKLLQHLAQDELKNDNFLLRELDVNDFSFGDYEKFCQEEVLIWLCLQGRLRVKNYVGSKDRQINGKDQYFWLLDVELINQLRYGPFLLDYKNETIKFENHDPMRFTTAKHKQYAWGIIFRMLIAAKGQRVVSKTLQQELRAHKIRYPVSRVVSELRDLLEDHRIPSGYFPRGTPGRGSRGYFLLETLPRQ